MGEKMARAEEPDEPPRKAPRLDLLLTAAASDSGRGEEAAESDSGRGEAAVAPVVSNLREEGAEGTSDNKQCNHAPTDIAQMEVVRSSLFSERAGMCELCEHPFVGSSILMCLECGRHFCSGLGSVEYPYGHSRLHAQEKQHWVSVLSENPESAFCFKCDCVVDAPRGTISGLLAAAEPEESGGHEPCHHVPNDDAHMEMVSSLASEHGGKCVHCKTFRESSILVCLECGLHLCTGLGSADSRPSGHSRLHAKQKQHWVAAMSHEPESAYCFKCKYVVCVSVPPDDVETGNSGAGGRAPKLSDGALNLITELSNAYRAYLRGYAIRGIPNMGFTCYLSAVVQCFLVLDKLRERMLAQEAPYGLCATALKELFAGTSAAEDLLNPNKLLTCVRLHTKEFQKSSMHDSHELLMSLRSGLSEEEEITNHAVQNGAPTVMDSIFGFYMSETRTCKCSFSSSLYRHEFYSDLSLSLPPKGPPSESAASSKTNTCLKSQPKIGTQLCPANEQSKSEKIQTIVECGDSHLPGSELKDVVVKETTESLEVDSAKVQSIGQSKDVVQGTFQAQEDRVSCSKLSQGIFEVPAVGLLPQNVSDVKFEDMKETTADSIASIEDCLSLFFEKNLIEWSCDNCRKVYEELNADRSKNGEQTMANANEDATVGGDQTEQSDGTTFQNEQSSGFNSLSVAQSSTSRQLQGSVAQGQILQTVDTIAEGSNLGISCGEKDSAVRSTPKESEFHAGNLEAVSSCLPAEKQTTLHKQIKMYQDSRKQKGLDHSACQSKDDRNKQRDGNGDAIQTLHFNNLPHVLTLHLKRTDNFERKISGYVRYKEYLDVGPFIDPSSLDKDNSIYRLVGVVEHRGVISVKVGHYVAYVRARKIGDPQQQSSCSHLWFCADDEEISEVTLEDVLKREAYILFYERMEG